MPDRTEPPTPRRREEVRRKGQVAKSAEVNSAAMLLAAMLLARPLGAGAYREMANLAKKAFAGLSTQEFTFADLGAQGMTLALLTAKMLFPIALALLAVGIVVNLAQVGILFSFEPLKPTLSRINPFEGAKRFLSWRGLVELVKALAKVAIVGFFAYSSIRGELSQIFMLPQMELKAGLGLLSQMGMSFALKSATVLLVVAALDYLFQRQQFEKSIWMSKQELLEEFRSAEGDPLLKSRIRGERRRFLMHLMHRMMQQVPSADVVVTNPTHLAVALKYDPTEMHAPRVVAKGQRLIAERIKAIARQNGIPIVRNRSLAQSLFKTVEIGMEIPLTLYRAVAEVLAFVYQLKHKVA